MFLDYKESYAAGIFVPCLNMYRNNFSKAVFLSPWSRNYDAIQKDLLSYYKHTQTVWQQFRGVDTRNVGFIDSEQTGGSAGG